MAGPLRLLIVEDRPDVAGLLVATLARGGFVPHWRRVASAAETRRALSEGPWDVAVADDALTTFAPVAALGLCRQIDPDLPFVVVADDPSGESAVETMRAGANYFLPRGNLPRLAAVIERELRAADDRRARRREEEAAARLAAIVESSGDAILATTLDGVITSWNAAAERLFGWTAGAILGQSAAVLVPAERRAAHAAVLARVRRGERVAHFETTRRRKDGSSVDVSVRVSPILDAGGTVIGVAKIVRDITADKRAAADRALLAAIVDSSDEAIVSADPAGIVLSWNPAAERLFGYTPAEAIGRSNFDLLVPPDRLDESLDRVERVRQGERLEPLETVRRHKNGTEVRVAVTVSAVYLRGEVIALSAVYRDNTDRHLAEEALRRSEQHLRTIIATTPECVKLVAADGTVLEMNAAGLTMLEATSPEQVLGQNVFGVIAPEHRAQFRTFHETVCAGVHGTITIDILGLRGGRRTVETSAVPLKLPEGKVAQLAVARDITRTRLLEAQVRQTHKMQAVGQLAGGIAHDFNNLLTVIRGYSDLLLQYLPRGDANRSLVEEICHAGERASALTRQLLLFSRRQVITPRVLDLNVAVGEAEKLLCRLLGEDVVFTAQLAAEELGVRADATQLEQVFMNLCVNARDAMPTGGRLTLATWRVELDDTEARLPPGVLPGAYALLTVTDTGTGMTAEVRDRLFEPFFTTKEVGKGTGLGLAVVHGIVKEAGGHIEVESAPGVGTTFKVYLPLAVEDVGGTGSVSLLRTPPPGHETVLIVEDEAAVRALTCAVLTGCGYTVLEADDGAAAVRLAATHPGPLHLLVTDVVLPGLGGRQVAEGVLALHPNARVLYVSGYTDDAVVRHGVLEDQVAFLQKPFSAAALAFKVRATLDATPSQAGR